MYQKPDIMSVIKGKNLNEIKMALRSDLDLTVTDKDGSDLITVAARTKNTDIVNEVMRAFHDNNIDRSKIHKNSVFDVLRDKLGF